MAIHGNKGLIMKRRFTNRNEKKRSVSTNALRIETLECRRLLAGDGLEPIDDVAPFTGAIMGSKWEDLDRNGERDAGEPGLAGVQIYLDDDFNGEFDLGEPTTRTRRDNPLTDVDESGTYRFRGLESGRYSIREVVPRGFRQTFPRLLTDNLADGEIGGGHVVFVPAGETVSGRDFGNYRLDAKPASAQGFKWEDQNGDGVRDPNETGLGGVIIYSDLNRNRRQDRGEPFTRTSRDNPETDFNESGFYTLSGLRPGEHVLREVVPDGYQQTFPATAIEIDGGGEADEFASVKPRNLNLNIPAGDVEISDVAISVHPFCLVPIEIDVVASDPTVELRNLSGTQVNGCGGDVSNFEIGILSNGEPRRFRIQFVNVASGETIGSIPVRLNSNQVPGAHVVELEPGAAIDNLDFGNRPKPSNEIQGTKWLDAIPNGIRDDDEPGLEGVKIYLDLNGNGRLDPREPSTLTARDNPRTPADETGQYRFSRLTPGEYQVREVVPNGFEQTFPGIGAEVRRSVVSRLNPGVALDLNLTDAEAQLNDDDTIDATVDVSVTWPDSCGTIKVDETMQAVVGQHLLIELSGHQVGDACAEVISTETIPVEFTSIKPGRYDVVVTLREDLPEDSALPTLATVGLVSLGGAGQHTVMVGAGELINGVDFGNHSEAETASIHGQKWLDLNGDGIRGRNEPAVAGITIYSDLNRNGQLNEDEPRAVTLADDPTTRIDETGHYWLEGLDPGKHFITEILPAGFERTFPPQLPSLEPWPANEPYHFDLLAGEALTGINFGNHPIKQESGGVQGLKWSDLNGNGIRDRGEPGLSGVTIYLDANLNNQFDDGELASRSMRDNPLTNFDESGLYSIKGADPGFYIVREIVPPGFEQTYPELMTCKAIFCMGRGHIVNIEAGQGISGLDFGNQPVKQSAGIHGVKWLDRDGDGQRDRGERGLAGVTIYSDVNRNGRRDRGEPSAETMRDNPDTDRDESGMYRLKVPAGEHLVLEVVPDGFEQTFPNPNRRIMFPLNLGHVVQVGPHSIVAGIDFGNQPIRKSAVEGVKWVDRNGNGIRERNEPGLSGVVVFSDLNDNGRHDSGEPATETQVDDPNTRSDEMGHYRLEGLRPGEHVIREVVPRGFQVTFPSSEIVIGDQSSEDLRPGRALSYELIDARADPTANGEFGLALTFEVVWPNGCGTLLKDRARASVQGNRIQVDMYGTQIGDICTMALKPERQTIRVDTNRPGSYAIQAYLNENGGRDWLPGFQLKGEVAIEKAASHHVTLKAGETLKPLNFGNQPIRRFQPADFNFDGRLNALDIDLMGIAIRSNRNAEMYDLTDDGRVDQNDFEFMIQDVLDTEFGDANLDGFFNSRDFVEVFRAGKYQDDVQDNASWAEGDWNGDGDFDSADLVYVFQKGEYGNDHDVVDAAFAE